MQCTCCGRAFFCGITAGGSDCWCMQVNNDMPALPLPSSLTEASCFCADCLRLAQAQAIGNSPAA
ncbi:MAG: cysteine-rich CWC family protein [Rhodocyclaceae bacterium]|nr:cysteine-rich CWC family protein [Rhodocyclaceae bacterium]